MTVSHPQPSSHCDIVACINVQNRRRPVSIRSQHTDFISLLNEALAQGVNGICRSTVDQSGIKRRSDVQNSQWLGCLTSYSVFVSRDWKWWALRILFTTKTS